VARFRRAIREAEGLADVNNIFFDGSIEERGVDVRLTHVEVHGGCNFEWEPEASHYSDDRERVSMYYRPARCLHLLARKRAL
jgi:hypothetical protein